MYKSVCAAVLLLTAFAFTLGRKSADASAATPMSPVIVASGRALNQTGPISTATIFTPKRTGLYRLSVYATVTKNNSFQDNWYYNLYWSDDAGAEQSSGWELTWNSQDSVPPNAAATNGNNTANVTTFEAVGGTPVSYSVVGPADGSAFSIYYTIEQL